MDPTRKRKKKVTLISLEKLRNDACAPADKVKSEIQDFYSELRRNAVFAGNTITSLDDLQENLVDHISTVENSFEEAELKVTQSDDEKDQWAIVMELQGKKIEIKKRISIFQKRITDVKTSFYQRQHVHKQLQERLTQINDSIQQTVDEFRGEITRAMDKYSYDETVRSSLILLKQHVNVQLETFIGAYGQFSFKVENSDDSDAHEICLQQFQTEKEKCKEHIQKLEIKLQQIVQKKSGEVAQVLLSEQHDADVTPVDKMSTNKPCEQQEILTSLYNRTQKQIINMKEGIKEILGQTSSPNLHIKISEVSKILAVHSDKLDAIYETALLKVTAAKIDDIAAKEEVVMSFQQKHNDIENHIAELIADVQQLHDSHSESLKKKEEQKLQLKKSFDVNCLPAYELKQKMDDIFVTCEESSTFIDKKDMKIKLNETVTKLNDKIKEYDASFWQEIETVDLLDDVSKQYENLINFNTISQALKTDVNTLNNKFLDIVERHHLSPASALARATMCQSEELGLELKPENNLKIFKLPMQETQQIPDDKLRRFELGATREDKDHRHILLVGMTGSGKSLLINNMINYIFGVSHKDKFRFKLIIETDEVNEREEGSSESQAESMTSWVTSYTFNWQEGFGIPYSLTIIDTPGFGDTRGLKYDEKLVCQIKTFFNNDQLCPTQELSCIGLLIQASQARITEEQKYIFDQVLNIFGKDMGDNIFLIFTFADAQPPPALKVVKQNKIPYAEGCTFKFNNSALYASNDDQESNYAWSFGYQNLERYFDELKKIQHKSLKLTKQVLDERDHLRLALGALQREITEGIETLRLIEDQSIVIIHLNGTIKTNKNFKIKKKSFSCNMKRVNHFITNCSVCNFTCHSPCMINGNLKQNCSAMSNGSCKICPSKCPYDMHTNGDHVYEYTPVEVEETIADMMKEYSVAVNDKNAKKKLLISMLEKYKKQKQQVFQSITQANKHANRLEKISLRFSYLTNGEYIERLIESEERSSNLYKRSRLGYLRHLKDMADTLKDARENPASLTNRVSEYEEQIAKLIANIDDNKKEDSYLGILTNWFPKYVTYPRQVNPYNRISTLQSSLGDSNTPGCSNWRPLIGHSYNASTSSNPNNSALGSVRWLFRKTFGPR